MKKVKMLPIFAVAVVAILVTSFIVYARSNPNPGVLPPTSAVQGLTYGDWLAKWWQYALTLPEDQNPLAGTTGENCVFQRVGNVGLILADSTLHTPITCEVPTGMMLYLEVLGAECSNLEEAPFYGGNEAELRACAQALVPEDLEASIDDREVQNLPQYITISPLFQFTEPEKNILGVPAGTIGESVGSGAYLLLEPLSPGKHTIYLKGTYPTLGYTADKTFDLTVSNKD